MDLLKYCFFGVWLFFFVIPLFFNQMSSCFLWMAWYNCIFGIPSLLISILREVGVGCCCLVWFSFIFGVMIFIPLEFADDACMDDQGYIIAQITEYVFYISLIINCLFFLLVCCSCAVLCLKGRVYDPAPIPFVDEEENINNLPNVFVNVEHDNIGLNTQDLKRLKKTKLCKANENNICTICLQNFIKDETLITLPQCQHLFHEDCIHKWLKGNLICPICRKNVKEALNNDR